MVVFSPLYFGNLQFLRYQDGSTICSQLYSLVILPRPLSNHGLENELSGNISFAMPEPIRRERKSRSGSVLASMNPRTMSLKKKKEEDNTVERIEVPYLCPIVLRKEVILQWMNSSFNYKISGWMYGKINVINSNGLSGISCLFQIQVQTSTTMM